MIFMTFMKSSFHTLSRRFVSFNDACVFSLGSIRIATSFLASSFPDLARHCCWHRNFQLSPRVLKVFFELLIRWINEVNTAQSFQCYHASVSRWPIFVFLFVAMLLTSFSTSLATSSQDLMSFVSLLTASRIMHTLLEVFFLPIR